MRIVLLSSLLSAASALCAACAPATAVVPAPPAAEAAGADTGRVSVAGGTLFYEVRGSGPAVVLLHAGRLDLSMWDPQVEPLTRSFRVIRYDARGHGRSAAPMGPFSMADDLGAVLDHLGVRRAHVVGLSMGAGAALDFATAHPERVSRLALVSTSGPPAGVPLPPGTPPALTQEGGRARLRALTMPRLLVVGEGDSPAVRAVAERVDEEVPEVQVVRIGGGEHLVNRDAAAAFNEVLLRFLRQE